MFIEVYEVCMNPEGINLLCMQHICRHFGFIRKPSLLMTLQKMTLLSIILRAIIHKGLHKILLCRNQP